MQSFLRIHLKTVGLIVMCFMSTASMLQAQSGHVFKDFNGNGTQDAGEPNLSGMTVNSYDDTGALVGTGSTNASGNYTLSPAATGPVRVEFEVNGSTCSGAGVANGMSGFGGAGYGTSVQFVSGAAANVDFIVGEPSEYHTDNNPAVFVPCYVNGDPLAGGSAGSDIALVKFDFNASGTPYGGPGPYTNLTSQDKLGSVWGQAYSRQANKIFLSAVMKRHSGFGPLHSGGIYLVTTAGTVTNWLDLDAIGIATSDKAGTYSTSINPADPSGQTVLFSPVIGTNTERGLPGDKTLPNNDPAAFAQVGRLGIGDIDISEDGRFLYVVNLYDRKVYELDLTDATNPVAPTLANASAKVRSWSVPDPGCTSGTYRPWACKARGGKVYIGLVCNGDAIPNSASGPFTEVVSYVYTLTPATGFTASPVFNLPMTYNKQGYGSSPGNWSHWTFTQGTGAYWSANAPVLADIEFDVDGSMILGWFDIGGMQGGNNNYTPSGTNQGVSTAEGDVLRAYPNPDCTGWTAESGGDKDGSGPYTPVAGQMNGGGPGGGEFYFQDTWETNAHVETSQGALAILPGTDITIMVGLDAVDWNSGGIFFLNNSTGQTSRRLGIFPAGTNPVYFGKAIGLGDVELVMQIPPTEIGSRIWNDADSDGIQDPSELPLSGVIVEIYDSLGTTLLGTATTDADGHVFFDNSDVTGGIQPFTNYQLRVASSQFNTTGTGPLNGFSPTTVNAVPTAGIPDVSDSDAVLAGPSVVLNFRTGTVGENNHTLDFGFRTQPPCPVPNCVTGIIQKN